MKWEKCPLQFIQHGNVSININALEHMLGLNIAHDHYVQFNLQISIFIQNHNIYTI